ncbi:MAG: FAD-binding oxidoreductase, partial [Sulfuriferula sp.]
DVLLCQAVPASDLVISAREVPSVAQLPRRVLPVRVVEKRLLADDVMLLGLQTPKARPLPWLAGQYLDILLPEGRRRAFSLANAPHDDALLQLHIRHVPGGEYTEHVFSTMKEKDILRIEGPLGGFFLREDSDKPIIFIAGGTGFAPIKAMMEHALHHHANREMVLYWGARQLRDLYLPHLASQWQQENPNVTFIPVLSEPIADDVWPGRTGLVVDAVLQDFPDLSGYQVYACGAPVMVEAAQTGCLQHGLPEAEFFADAFLYQSNNTAN